MNNIYRVIWNASLCVWQAVSEIASVQGKSKSVVAERVLTRPACERLLPRLALAGVSMACALAWSQTLPVPSSRTGFAAVSGGSTPDASVVTAGSVMTITQTANKAILNWESFNVGPGKTVDFQQPSASAVALNRVVGLTGADITRSMIDGAITSTGQVFLINPAGITFGQGSQVNVGGIVASTRDIADANFLNPTDGKYNFTVKLSDPAATNNADVTNNGTITATQYVALVGAKVINIPATGGVPADAKITAPHILLGAGDDILLQLDGVPTIQITRSNANALIDNGGMLVSNNGQIWLTAAAADNLLSSAINNAGVVEATGISVSDGVVRFEGASTLSNTGTIKSNKSSGAGGNIELTASTLTLGASSVVDASGALSGSVTTDAQAITINSGAKVKTLKDATDLGVWTVKAADVYVTTDGVSSAATARDKITTVDLLNTDRTVNASSLLGSYAGFKTAADAAAKDVGNTPQTTLSIAKGWNVIVADALVKPDAATQVITGTTPVPVPQDVTLTLKTERDIQITNDITSSSNKGRLNLVLDAGNDVTISGKVTTANGNLYVGAVSTPGVNSASPSLVTQDTVIATGKNFTITSTGNLNVGSGHFVARVDDTITNHGTLLKTGSYGTSNITKKSVYANQWMYPSITYGGVYTATTNSVDLEAASVVGSGTLTASGGIVNATALKIGDVGTSLKVNANSLNVTNKGTGGTYIDGNNANISLTTYTTTSGTQKITTPTANLEVVADSTGQGKLTVDADKINGNGLTSLTITAPNIHLAEGAIRSTTGTTLPSSNDPSILTPTGLQLTLTAKNESGTYGDIMALQPATIAAGSPTAQSSTVEIHNPNGTVTLNAKNIGIESGNTTTTFAQALEINATTLNANNYGGATWLANSDYNALNFTSQDPTGSATGYHHILSKNGDFFNAETTSGSQLVIYSIDRTALTANTTPTATTSGRLSGIFTRSTAGNHKNVSLGMGLGNQARDIVLMNDAVDLGAATMAFSVRAGSVTPAKSLIGSSATQVQNDTPFSGTLTTHTAGNSTSDIPHITAGNLSVTLPDVGSSIGANDYILKVAKGGGGTDVNTATNKLDILNSGGSIYMRELSAEHFKDISINTYTTSNRNSTVSIDLFNNNAVTENLNYAETSAGGIVFGATDAALSGYNRNFNLYAPYKDVTLNGFGTANAKITSGNLSVTANSLKLGGDILTTHRANSNSAFDTGHVSLKTNSIALTSNVKILTEADPSNNDTRTPGNISIQRFTGSGALPVSGNGFDFELNAASQTPTTVGGGSVTAYVVAAGTSGNALNDLSFKSNTLANGTGGTVNIFGNQFDIAGDFTAQGKVSIAGSNAVNNVSAAPFSIKTNLGSGNSGNISFDGYSLSINKGYGDAVFDTSRANASDTAGNITLWSSGMTSVGSVLNFGSVSVSASNSAAASKSGAIAVDNVTTTGSATSSSGSSYSAANQTYTGKQFSVAGNLTARSGGSTGSDLNTGNISVLADTVIIADDVRIQTYNGYTGSYSTAHKTGQAGDVTLGNSGALWVAGVDKTLAIDASAGRNTGSLTGASSFTAQHGTVTINAASPSPVDFEKLTIIGKSGSAGTLASLSNFRTTGQLTLGILDPSTVTLSGLRAGSLLLLGDDSTSYTVTDAQVGNLAASAVNAISITSAGGSSALDLTVGSLTNSGGNFAVVANGITAKGQVDLVTPNSKINVNSSITGEGIALSTTSTDASKGGVTLNGAVTLDSGAQTLSVTTQAGDITVPQAATLKSTLATGRSLLLSSGLSSQQDGHVVLGGVGPTINLGADAHGVIYTGDWNVAKTNSLNGYTSLGAGHYNYGVSSLNAGFTPDANNNLDLATQKTYALFRGDMPNVDVTIANKNYNGLGFELFSSVAGNSALSVSGLLFADKTKYETGTATQKADVASYLLGLNANALSISRGNTTYAQADVKDVGQYVVSLSGGTSPSALGYGITMPSTNSTNYEITPKQLAVALSNVTKTYNGTTGVAIAPTQFQFSGFVNAGEQTDFSTRGIGIQSAKTGTFNSKNVVDANQVTVTLTNADLNVPDALTVQLPVFKASNYTIAQTISGAGAIVAAPLTVAFNNTANLSKTYDGSSVATINPSTGLVLSGVASGDAIALNVSVGDYGYTNSSSTWVNSGKVLEVTSIRTNVASTNLVPGTGTSLTNYSFTSSTPQALTSILPKPLTANATAQDKPFDGKTDATATVTFDKSGLVGSDSVAIGFADANFDTSKVGINKTVTLSNVALTGADASNYAVSVDGVQSTSTLTTTAAILPIDQAPVIIRPPAPAPVAIVPPNTGNTPVNSLGGLGVINLDSGVSTSAKEGSSTLPAIEATVSISTAQPNQVYVLDGGIKTDK